MTEKTDWEHIGDGVYVGFDGYGIWLHANSHDNPTDKIYIEPDVFVMLENYIKRLKEKYRLNSFGE